MTQDHDDDCYITSELFNQRGWILHASLALNWKLAFQFKQPLLTGHEPSRTMTYFDIFACNIAVQRCVVIYYYYPHPLWLPLHLSSDVTRDNIQQRWQDRRSMFLNKLYITPKCSTYVTLYEKCGFTISEASVEPFWLEIVDCKA